MSEGAQRRRFEIGDASSERFTEQIERSDLALVPVGSVEGYGRHLPLGTDGLIALALARAAADRVGCAVSPLIPVGWTADFPRFPGSLSVSTAALHDYCRGIGLSLVAGGLKRVVFINGHAGNITTLEEVCYELASAPDGPYFASVNVWQLIQPLAVGLLESRDNKLGHGGELNTSLMLHLYPNLVEMSATSATGPARSLDGPGISRPFQFSEVAPSGSLGDPTLASAQKGRHIFDLAVNQVAKFLGEDM